MEEIMIRILNMSFAAGCTVALVLLLRIFFRRLPKGYFYGLWFIVLFRFLCPIAIPSPFSLFPVNPEPVSQEIVYRQEPEIQTGMIWVDRAVNRVVGEKLAAENPENSINPVQVWLGAGFFLWTAGMAVLSGVYVIQFLRLRRKLAAAIWVEEAGWSEGRRNKEKIAVRETDQIDGAFVLGIVRPVIYLPSGLEDENREYVLHHESVHVRRKDYAVKLLGILAVTVHWFNPFAWIGFWTMCEDMEMSCDEQVLKDMGRDKKKAYSQVLLSETERRSGLWLPPAFGRNSVFRRIQNILRYHKPGTALTIGAVLLLAAAGVGLMTNPQKEKEGWGKEEAAEREESQKEDSVSIIGGADGPVSIFVAGKIGEDDDTWQNERPDSAWLASVRIVGGLEGQDIEEGIGERPKAQEGQGVQERQESRGSQVFLDFASDQSLIFHGDFGLFSFEKGEDGRWTQKVFVSDEGMGKEMGQGVGLMREQVSVSDGFLMAEHAGTLSENQNMDCDAVKMADGQVAVLGVWADDEGEGRLIDLYYGYYDPQKQEMNQVFLFVGDGRERSNPKGEICEAHWLFARDGYDYYVRTPREALPFEQSEFENFNLYHIPYDRMELARSRENQDQMLDALMFMERGGRQKIVLTEERLIYEGFADADMMSMKHPLPVSICMDGSDRQAGQARYGVAEALCYADHYLYYEGWTNDQAFPRPLMRMRADFSGEEKVGDLPGSLITVRDGGVCLWMDWESKRIMAGSVENIEKSEEYWSYLKNGETGKQEVCRMENRGDGQLWIVLADVEEPSKREEFWLWIPGGLWEEEF